MSQSNSPTLSLFEISNSKQESVITRLHLKTTAAIKNYQSHIEWLNEQINTGNIDKAKLFEIITKAAYSSTHQSPIELAIDKLYVDPLLASMIEKTPVSKPDAPTHLTAKLLTLNQLCLNDFPKICQNSAFIPTAL